MLFPFTKTRITNINNKAIKVYTTNGLRLVIKVRSLRNGYHNQASAQGNTESDILENFLFKGSGHYW